MSKRPSDFIDPDFWVWYHSKGPDWLVNKRLDILLQMYDAYEDEPLKPVTMVPGQPFFFMGDTDELAEFVNALQSILRPLRKPRIYKNKTSPITDEYILNLYQKLKTIKFKRRKNNEDNKS